MRRLISFLGIVTLTISIFSSSCNNTNKEIEENTKIENTLQSVSFMKDTFGYDTKQLLEAFNTFNAVIDSIGYPDAGYKLWMIQEDSSEIRFMIEGLWPDQTVYDEIHDHPLYKEAWASDDFNWDGLVRVEYHRFIKLK